MVRKLRTKENPVINLDEYLENKSKYSFEIEKPLKSELNLDNPSGQGVPSGKRGITTLRTFKTPCKPLILLRL